MSHLGRLLAALALTCLTVPALAADPYLTAKMLDLTVLVPPPPAKGSPADQADMQAVLAAQAAASEARKQQALADSEETVFVMFTPVLGEKFTAAAMPKAAAMFARLGDSEDDTLDAAKPYFGRVRPWLANPEVGEGHRQAHQERQLPLRPHHAGRAGRHRAVADRAREEGGDLGARR